MSTGSQPPLLYPPYGSTVLRAPARPLIRLPHNFSDFAAPVYGYRDIAAIDADLTALTPTARRRIIVGGACSADDRPMRHTLVGCGSATPPGVRHAVDDHQRLSIKLHRRPARSPDDDGQCAS
jgi:protocatechuate 3,4-dioxygenase beta subunit